MTIKRIGKKVKYKATARGFSASVKVKESYDASMHYPATSRSYNLPLFSCSKTYDAYCCGISRIGRFSHHDKRNLKAFLTEEEIKQMKREFKSWIDNGTKGLAICTTIKSQILARSLLKAVGFAHKSFFNYNSQHTVLLHTYKAQRYPVNPLAF
jgi:hypothetical protein